MYMLNNSAARRDCTTGPVNVRNLKGYYLLLFTLISVVLQSGEPEKNII